MISAPSICQNVIFLAKKIKSRTKIISFKCFWAETRKSPCTAVSLASLNFFKHKICFKKKKKILEFGTKIDLIGYFWLKFQKTVMSYLKSASSYLLTYKALSKTKTTLKLGPRIPYLGNLIKAIIKFLIIIFHPKFLIIIFHSKWKVINLGPFSRQSVIQKQKNFKLRTKNVLFRSLEWNSEKLYWHF